MPRRTRPSQSDIDNAISTLRRAGGSVEGYQGVVERLRLARKEVLEILGYPNDKSSRVAARRVVGDRDYYRQQLQRMSRDIARAGKYYTEVPINVAVKALVDATIFYRDFIKKAIDACGQKSNDSPTQ